MEFYGRYDFTVGNFLERLCFRESYTCPSETCETPMLEHVRRFVHENGCINIILRKVESSQTFAYPDHILMWNWCRKCKKVRTLSPFSGHPRSYNFW